jgi:hypothetical protein
MTGRLVSCMADRIKLYTTSPGSSIVHLMYQHAGVTLDACRAAEGAAWRRCEVTIRGKHVTCLECLYNENSLVSFAKADRASLLDNEERVANRRATRSHIGDMRKSASSASARAALEHIPRQRARKVRK